MFRRSRARTILLLPLMLIPLAGAGAIASVEGAAQRSAEESVPRSAVFRGTTNLRAVARANGPSALPGLSLDRIRRKSEPIGEGGHDLLQPPGAAPVVVGSPVAGPPKSLLTSFDGLGAFDNEAVSGFNVEPPDQGLCVGNGFVLESINVTLQPFDAAGTPLLAPVEQNVFYGFPPGFDLATGEFGPLLADPSCLFDPESRRWFHTILVIDADPVTGALTGPNSIDIAVSRTSDPTGIWNLYSIPAQNDGTEGTPDHGCLGQGDVGHGPCIGDYPHIGLDHNGLYITTNEYTLFGTTQFTGAQLYAMSKDALASGAQSVSFVHIENLTVPERGQTAFTLRAANAPGTDWSTLKHGTAFFVSGMVGFESGNTSPEYDAITLWALSNTASLDAAAPSLTLRYRVVDTELYQIPPPAPQRPGDLPLGQCLNLQPCIDAFGPPPGAQGLSVVDSLDGRMLGSWYADGLLWFSLGTGVDVGGQELAGILYGALEPSFKKGKLRAKLRMQEYLAVQGNNVIMPAVGVDANGRGYLVFTLVGPDHFPSAAVAKISLGKPAARVNVVAICVGPQDGFSGYWIGGPRPRWGDYFYSAVDEQGNVWLAGEYIAQTCTFTEWITGDLTCGGTRGAFANFATRVMELK